MKKVRPDYSVTYLYNVDRANYISFHGRIILRKLLQQMATKKKEVRFLSVGDILSGSRAKVISSPTAGIKTPGGKVEIGIEYPNGVKKIKEWGKYTLVSVDVPNAPVTTKPTEQSGL
jgi:hypothetical protein